MAGLPKQARLLNKTDYNAVFNKSVKVSDANFLVLIHKTKKPYSRLGLVISKKVDKRAVVRNRIKRIIRESFRNHEFSVNCDFVLLARPVASKKTNKDLFSSINNLWNQAESRINKIRKSK